MLWHACLTHAGGGMNIMIRSLWGRAVGIELVEISIWLLSIFALFRSGRGGAEGGFAFDFSWGIMLSIYRFQSCIPAGGALFARIRRGVALPCGSCRKILGFLCSIKELICIVLWPSVLLQSLSIPEHGL